MSELAADDASDGRAWAACFTPDGTFSNRAGSHSGREVLEAYGNDFSRARNARYWIDNLVLEATPEGARGSCYLLILQVGRDGGAQISLTGVYTDELVKVGGEWKFAKRYVARDLVRELGYGRPDTIEVEIEGRQ